MRRLHVPRGGLSAGLVIPYALENFLRRCKCGDSWSTTSAPREDDALKPDATHTQLAGNRFTRSAKLPLREHGVGV